jgi:hypothetical protein
LENTSTCTMDMQRDITINLMAVKSAVRLLTALFREEVM